MSKGKPKMNTESGRIFFCTLQVYFTNMVLLARKPTFLHYLRGKQNLFRCCLFLVQTSEKITYNSTVFTEQYIHLQDKLHSLRTIEARASLPQQIIKMTTT